MGENTDWMQKRWRPAMGWTYMVTCITDFVIFPVLWAIFQAYMGIRPVEPWNPLTLQGAGLFHVAMGAVLGVAAWGRTKEKVTAFDSAMEEPKPVINSTPSININQKPVVTTTVKKGPPPVDEPLI